jgi:hypothetical protein
METASSYSGDLEYATKGRNKTGNKILVSIRQNGRAHSISGKNFMIKSFSHLYSIHQDNWHELLPSIMMAFRMNLKNRRILPLA